MALALFACSDGSEKPWPPAVQQVSQESPALSPEAALKTFFLPPGFRLELVASEPMIADPVWIDFDADGRLWVVEMRGFMPDSEGQGERAPVGRIVVLEDVDDDGRMDRHSVFLDGLVLPRSVKVLAHGVLVAAPPHLWLARDTNGDLRADTKEAVREDFGRADGNPEHNANGLLWALDNWIYTSEHDGHGRLKNGQWEHHETLPLGQWGLSMDDFGRVYRNWNDDPLRVDLFPARYFMRNPHVVRTRGVYEPLTREIVVWPVRPNPGVNRGYREGTRHDDGSLAVFAAAGTPVAYRGDRLPADLQGNVFVTEPAGNLVRRFIVEEDGSGRLRARNAYDRAEFIASTDERFRPVNLFSAPDGTLYVVDMYRGVIQHRQYQSEYLKNYIHDHGLAQPIGHGRIYRVVHQSTRRDRRPWLSGRSARELVDILSHPNGWWRDTAQRLLVERGERSAAAALRQHATDGADARTRLHALWTLDGLDAIDPDTVARALDDRSPHVRASAVRLSERWLRDGKPDLQAAVTGRLEDRDPAVRRQAILSCGALPPDVRVDVLGSALERHGDDPIAVDAAVSGLQGHEARVLERLLEPRSRSAGSSPLDDRGAGALRPGSDAVAMLAGAVVRSGDESAAQRLFGRVAESNRPQAQRLALLTGIETALFPARGPAGPSITGAPRIRLSRRPATLIAMASEHEQELSARAERILAVLDWPGRLHKSAPVPPLTPGEQKRFASGQETYRSLCAACHQADGRGRQNVAPPLVGSKWALGRPGLAARIVLNGKEETMLMPPLQTMSDEQIAAVLTYVRRAWGHGASPVDAALVREARGASTGRMRPWTDQELAAVTQPDGAPPIGVR